MTWFSPWAFALAGLLLPLVVAFLNRRRVIKQRVPSLILLKPLAVQEPSSRSFALPKHLIALILCALALIALVFALARPTSSDSEPRRYIIILDTSASMNARAASPDAQSRFDSALSTLRTFSESLYEDDELVLITAGTQTRVASGLMRDHKQFLELVQSQTPSGQGQGLTQALRLADALCQDPSRSSVLLLSDDAASLREAQQTSPPRCPIHLSSLNTPLPNVGITAMSVREADALGLTELYVEVFNHDLSPRRVPIDLSLDGRIIEAFTLDIPPGKAVGRLVRAPLPPGDVVQARLVSPSPDALPDDNVAYASRQIPATVKVLLVGEHERSFSAEALRLHPRVHLTRVSARDPMPQGPFSLIVLESEPLEPLPPGQHVVGMGIPHTYFDLKLRDKVVTPTIIRWSFDHPLFRFVEMDSTRMDATRALEVPDGGRSLTDVYEGSIIVETPWKGRTLIYMGFRPERTDMVLRVAFVNFVANMIEWAEPTPELARQTLLPVGQRVADTRPGMTLLPLHRQADPFDAAERVSEPGVYRLLDEEKKPTGQLAVNLLSLQETELGDVPSSPAASTDPSATQTSPSETQEKFKFAEGLPQTQRGESFPWQVLLLVAMGLVLGEWLAQPLVQIWDRRKDRQLNERIKAQRAST